MAPDRTGSDGSDNAPVWNTVENGMKITFIKECQNYWSGNSLYVEGNRADLPHGKELVAAGFAVIGWCWEKPKVPCPTKSPRVEEEEVKQRKDDLVRVRGIGLRTARKLNELGINTFEDIVEADASLLFRKLKGVLGHMTKGKIRRWQESARSLLED